MQSLKNKTKAELINIISELEVKRSQHGISSERLNRILFDQNNDFDKLESLIKLSNDLFQTDDIPGIGKVLYNSLKKFERPGNWGIKLAVYDEAADEYWIVFPDSQPCVCAPVLTRCKYEEIGYYSKIALDSRKTLLIEDNHSQESLKIDSRQIALSRGAMIFIPLIYEERIVGLFSYSSSPINSIDEDFKIFLETISRFLTYSIAKIFEKKSQGVNYSSKNDSVLDSRYKRLIDVITDYHYQVLISKGKPVKTVHTKSSILVTGYSPEELDNDGFLWFKMIYQEDRQKVQQFIDKLFSDLIAESIVHRIIRKDGVLRWVKNTIIPELGSDGKLISYDGLLQDITEQKLYEEQIKLSEEKLNKVFNQSPDLLFIVSYADGIISDINHTAITLLGVAKQEVTGKSIVDTGFLDKNTFETIKIDIDSHGFYKNYSYRFALNQDDVYDIDINAELIEISGVKSILITGEDRTKQRRMQLELERIHNLESIGILAGGIAHDFNNVLTAILGNISFVKMNMSAEDRMYKFLSRAEDSCFKAKELSNKLLTFSKGGKPKVELIPVEKLIQDYAMLSLSGSNVFMNFQIKDIIDKVAVDQEQIRQVVTSIVENAKEAMPHGGELIVRIENETVSAKSSLPLQKGDYVKISFIDHGMGITQENIAKVFDPYFSTKSRGNEKGMGLGLSISYSIINKHSGAITVSSQLGLGSTFSVYLPSVKDK